MQKKKGEEENGDTWKKSETEASKGKIQTEEPPSDFPKPTKI